MSTDRLSPVENDVDTRLMLRVRDSDDALAFEELVSRYQQRLLTILFHWCGSREWAEDLCQDVFLRVFRARKQYQPTGKFSTWLFTIAHHTASNGRRSRMRRREVRWAGALGSSGSVLGMEHLAVASSGQMPTRLADKSELAQAVRLAVAGLNDRQRLAVLLSKFEHMSYEEIAVSMNLTIPAVKSLLVRARECLRQKLQPFLDDGQLPLSLPHTPPISGA